MIISLVYQTYHIHTLLVLWAIHPNWYSNITKYLGKQQKDDDHLLQIPQNPEDFYCSLFVGGAIHRLQLS